VAVIFEAVQMYGYCPVCAVVLIYIKMKYLTFFKVHSILFLSVRRIRHNPRD
jgi:hypothetical protein